MERRPYECSFASCQESREPCHRAGTETLLAFAKPRGEPLSETVFIGPLTRLSKTTCDRSGYITCECAVIGSQSSEDDALRQVLKCMESGSGTRIREWHPWGKVPGRFGRRKMLTRFLR